jgi:hypothetical protein|nr:MAG TPA: hypothetical protein [Caudoviricetes sp.]
MKALMIDEKYINRLIDDFGFKNITLYNEVGEKAFSAIAYEYDTNTYIAIRKQEDKYILEFLELSPDVYIYQDLICYTKTYTCYYLPSILLKLIECGIIKECEIEDYN